MQQSLSFICTSIHRKHELRAVPTGCRAVCCRRLPCLFQNNRQSTVQTCNGATLLQIQQDRLAARTVLEDQLQASLQAWSVEESFACCVIRLGGWLHAIVLDALMQQHKDKFKFQKLSSCSKCLCVRIFASEFILMHRDNQPGYYTL